MLYPTLSDKIIQDFVIVPTSDLDMALLDLETYTLQKDSTTYTADTQW